MRVVLLDESVSVLELAEALESKATTVVGIAFKDLGVMATIHEELSFEQASAIAARLGFVARRKGGPAGG